MSRQSMLGCRYFGLGAYNRNPQIRLHGTRSDTQLVCDLANTQALLLQQLGLRVNRKDYRVLRRRRWFSVKSWRIVNCRI